LAAPLEFIYSSSSFFVVGSLFFSVFLIDEESCFFEETKLDDLFDVDEEESSLVFKLEIPPPLLFLLSFFLKGEVD